MQNGKTFYNFLEILRERVHFSQTTSWTKLENIKKKKRTEGKKKKYWHVDTINLRFYSHIRFYTTISYIQPPLRDPEAFSRLPAKKVRAWRKQGIKKGVAVLWRNFLCAFKTPRASKGGDGVRIFPELLFERQKFHSRLNLVIGWRTSI